MKKLIIFSGAGISAESGLSTFRDNGGLWDQYPIEEVATYDAWLKNPKKVTEFYNLRRKNCIEAKPNDAHIKIASLEKNFNVTIVTQNIDDLHERAGSTKIVHLHGEIMKSRSSVSDKTYPINGSKINENDLCPEGHQLRPHVVWFGENVPHMDLAMKLIADADVFVIIGTSLQVYPAAGLIHATKRECLRYIIDPSDITVPSDVIHIKKRGSEGVKELMNLIK
ncbi:MAG: NAD-dependent deacylase [Flavobacteriales bacterium]|nr:NAD-dependent deacylase [Flavobacteriales bacterium]